MDDLTMDADRELRRILAELRDRSGLTYEQLAEASHWSRGTIYNYVTKSGHQRHADVLERLLTVLHATDDERAEVLRLHRLCAPVAPEPDCATWPIQEFTPILATVHAAIGRRSTNADAPVPYVLREHDKALRAD